MNEFAPVGISTYARVHHLKRTIEALRKNTLAKESELFIFSDAPQKGDESKIAKVREFIHTISGFREVHVIERKTNSRIENNRGGMEMLLNNFGKMIFLEEDILTAPGFLKFMNEALDTYEKSKKIISIVGYCPPIKIPSDIKEDVFLLKRFSSWGFATWKSKFDPFGFDLKKEEVDQFIENKKAMKEFLINGEDMMDKLVEEASGNLDALDIKLMYYGYKHDMYTIYPRKSLVLNIGHDGTGIHCVETDRFNVEPWDKTGGFIMPLKINIDDRIVKANRKFRSFGIKGKAINTAKSMGLYPFYKYIKHRVKG